MKKLTLEERKKATEKKTDEFIEKVRRKRRKFVLTLINGIKSIDTKKNPFAGIWLESEG